MSKLGVLAARACTRVLAGTAAAILFGGGFQAAQAQTPQHVHEQDEHAASEAAPPPTMRQGSGTAWLPDATPMYAIHGRRGAWDLMGHGSLFLQYLSDGGDRGHDQFGSINWMMGMAERSAGGGRFGVRAMISLEAWTIGGCGYPDLLASGETCDGHAIVDQQHPHDLLMELAAHYERPLSRSVSMQIYGGPAGEPALGPVAFPHRLSAMANPLAPISHHWLDATHITYGVVTGAFYGRTWKAEASLFNGREPDDRRTDLDLAALDSWSGRAWWLPADRLAFQVSAGRLREAEAPGVDLTRITASATYHRPLKRDGIWASTLAWGRNGGDDDASGFVMAESSAFFNAHDVVFARVDAGTKPAHDLGSDTSQDLGVAKLQAGYVRYLTPWRALTPGIGGTISLGVVPSSAAAAYGGRAVLGAGVFLTLRPAAMAMTAADPHAGHHLP